MEDRPIRLPWSDWEAVSVLGSGSYGTVYKAVRRDEYLEAVSAVKVVSIPLDGAAGSLKPEGLEDPDRSAVRAMAKRVVEEIAIMQSLKGTQNVVSVEDYRVVEDPERPVSTVFIRMELLTPLSAHFSGRAVSEEEIVRLGRDVCAALELCEKRCVIHRDVKPENIFVNDFGDFKLGDFGIAKVLTAGEGESTSIGTRNYMAPEVAAYRSYDARADLYSLGMTLYRLLNDDRLPFYADKRLYTPADGEEALRRRMAGEEIPPPAHASPALARVILKALSYRPRDRYATAAEMRAA
ncbi:MAG: serine/threonine protein kinase, partial [Clostridia bacterium]|nr:serine/threonine protein kinase [Clostridia bacterium]